MTHALRPAPLFTAIRQAVTTLSHMVAGSTPSADLSQQSLKRVAPLRQGLGRDWALTPPTTFPAENRPKPGAMPSEEEALSAIFPARVTGILPERVEDRFVKKTPRPPVALAEDTVSPLPPYQPTEKTPSLLEGLMSKLLDDAESFQPINPPTPARVSEPPPPSPTLFAPVAPPSVEPKPLFVEAPPRLETPSAQPAPAQKPTASNPFATKTMDNPIFFPARDQENESFQVLIKTNRFLSKSIDDLATRYFAAQVEE